MRNKLILACLAIVCAQGIFSQNTTETYQPLVCSGKIPADVLTNSSEKYERAAADISKKNTRKKEAKTRKRFVLESTFVMDNLLRSGRVLFNDEVSVYLNEVAQKLVDAKPLEKKQPVQVYALRSGAVNAFATDRGDVFVTLGMLAQLENEAQLAYIIAHELTHVERSHAMSFYLVADKINRGKGSGVLSQSLPDDKILAKCAFSKEQESEADRTGLDRFLLTRYSATTLPVVFDVLKYSYLPFDEQPFDRGLLQSEHYRLPDTYWLDQVKPIEGVQDEEDDSHQSHPNLKARREALAQALIGHKGEGRSDFLVSADRFNRVRNKCRMELTMLYLHDDRLPEAVYTTGLLLQKDPANLWLQKNLLKALYMHAKLRNDEDFSTESSYREIEGELQRVYRLMEKVTGQESIVLALQYALRLQEKYPQDEEIGHLTTDLFSEMARAYEDLNKFSALPPVHPVDATASGDTAQANTDASKFDKIRKKKEAEKATRASNQSDYWRFAFVGQLDSEHFKKQWEAARKRQDASLSAEEENASSKAKRALARQRKRGLRLDISNIVVVNPFYLKLDEHKNNAVRYIATEEGGEHFRDLLREVSAKVELKTTFLDASDLQETQTDAFNDLRFLNEWFAEQVHHYNLSLTPGYDQERINTIAQKYGTDYFLWTGIVSMRKKNFRGLYLVPLSALGFLPSMPIAVYAAIKPRYEMFHYAILYDVRTGRREVIKFNNFKRHDGDGVVKAHLYDTFSQIRRERK